MNRNELQARRLREAEKHRLDEAAAVQVYESYVATFKSSERDLSDKTKTFVRGGIFNPDTATTTSNEKSTPSSATHKVSETYTLGKVSTFTSSKPEEKVTPPKALVPMHNNSNSVEQPSEDPAKMSTNLFIKGIAPNVNEEALFCLFSKWGPVASVKIMWPRTQDDKSRMRNTGFVAYMARECAEKALQELDGAVFSGVELHVEWSKPIQIPVHPLALLTDAEAMGLPKLRTLVAWPVSFEQMRNSQAFVTASAPAKPSVVVVPPESKKQRFVIDYLAKVVTAKGGRKFEEVVMAKEKGNPLYAFLADKASPDYVYYKWRVYSYAQGDTEHKWSVSPFQMYAGGPWWLPPPFTRSSSDGVGLGSDETKMPLSVVNLRRFEKLLNGLTISNSKICQAMDFALDHAASAEQVVKMVANAFLSTNVTAPLMIARLFLVSDILYNSSSPAKNAYAYKPLFQKALPGIFQSLALFYRGLLGRLTAMHFKDQVERVICVWEQWSLFSTDFISLLRKTMENVPNPTNFSLKRPAESFEAAVPVPPTKKKE